ncbi:uncharacterized protein TNCV_4387481 [Trichonephila clavipes]|nr:uncharacterized protein TNCV_4387481 [Trichonephila clavipes]
MSFTRRPGSGCPRWTSGQEDHHIVRNARVQSTASSPPSRHSGATHEETGLQQVIFSDEYRFNLSRDYNRVHVWRLRGKRLNPAFVLQRHTAPTAGVMVWSAIVHNTWSSLVLIRGSMTTQWYVHDILQPHVLTLMRRLQGAIFQQDNAQPHTARVSWLLYPQLLLPFLGLPNTQICLQSSISGIIWDGELGIPRIILWHYILNDHQARRRFVEWTQNEIAVVPDFHKRILFSDEAHFWLNGYVNKQNCRIWSEANPQVYVETPLHPEKLTVWCALWAGGIIGPYFFKNDEGHNVTVNGDRYRAMISNFFILELNNHDVQELWFQQDGATCHTARATIDLLKDTFGDRLISRFGPVNWPPRSCDLTPLDYFLWDYVKSLVYADKPQTLDHLEDNIRRVIADIQPQMLEKVIENWTSRLDYIRASRDCQKSYLKCNATRLSFE